MATNKLQSPSASFAKTLTKPSIPNRYEAFSDFAPNNIKGVELPDAKKAFEPFTKKSEYEKQFDLEYGDFSAKTGVGGYGEGHTVKEIKAGLNLKGEAINISNEVAHAKMYEEELVGGKLESKLAKKADDSLFSSTDKLNIFSSMKEIKLAKAKAEADVNDFLYNDNSVVRKAFKANLGEEALYNYELAMRKRDITKEGVKAGGKVLEDVNLERGIRGVRTMGIVNALLDVTSESGSDYSAYLAGIAEAEQEGAQGVIHDWTTPTANFLGTGLEYAAGGVAVRAALTTGLIKGGLALGGGATTVGNLSKIGTVLESPVVQSTRLGSFGTKMAKAGIKIDMFETSHPILWSATVDNVLTTSIDYGIQSGIGKDISYSDFTSDIVTGGLMPPAFLAAGKGVTKSYGWAKKTWSEGVTARDIANLEKAIANDMKVNGSTNIKEAFNNIEENFVFSDNKTLSQKIAEYKAEVTKNPDAEITPEQVMSDMASKGQSISKGGAKRIAKSINSLNERVKPNGGGSLGESGINDRIQMTKQTILGKIIQESVVTAKKADDILESAHIENNLEYKSTKLEQEDVLDDLLHNPEFSPKKLDEAKTIDEVSKVIDAEKPTIKDVEDARANIDVHNLKSPEDVKKLAESQGVKFDSEKAMSKDNILNTDYLHKIVNDVEASIIGFTKYANKIRKEFISKAKSEAKDIKEFGRLKLKPRELGNEGAAIVKRLTAEISKDIDKLKSASTLIEKNSLKKAIAKKNAEIQKVKDKLTKANEKISQGKTKFAEMKGKLGDKARSITEAKNKKIDDINEANASKNRDRRALIALGKSEIDIAGNKPEYKILSTQKIIAIKNEFKARILNKSTIKELEDILVDFNEKIYKESYKAVVRAINSTVEGIKNSTGVDVEFRNKIIQIHSDMVAAKEAGDLVKMNETLESIKSFAKEGREVHKEVMAIRTQATQNNGETILKLLDDSGEGQYKTRLINTQAGNQGELGPIQKFRRYAESALQTHTQLSRIFEDTYVSVEKMINGKLKKVKQLVVNPANKIFNIDIQRAASKAHSMEVELMDRWLPKLSDSIQKGLGGGNPAHNRALYNFWKIRNRGFGDYTLRDLVFMKKGANGNWEYIPTMAPDTFRKNNAKLIEDGTIVDFHNSPKEVNKEIMDSIYARFDKMYADTNSDFHIADNEWRAHSIANGLKLKALMKEEFNLDWKPDGEHYWPIIHTNRVESSEIVNDVAGIEANYRRSINDSFTKEIEGAEGLISTYHDPVRIVGHHVRGNIYYGEMLKPLRRAQSLLNLMRKGKAGIQSKDLGLLMEDITKEISVKDGEVDPFSIGSVKNVGKGFIKDPIMSIEVDRLIESHINKVATHGASLGLGVDMGGTQLLDSIFQKLYNQMLSGLLTPLKQPVSILEGVTQGGAKNGLSASISSENPSNVGLLLDSSGMLLQRFPPIYSNEGAGRLLRDTSHEPILNWIGDAINSTINHTTGNIIKTVDGGVALFNFMVGASKYLDEFHPELHTAGKYLDLNKIKNKLSPEEWDNVLGYSENFMNRVMSSTNKVNDAIGSRDPLMRIVLFLGKTGLNSTTLFLENVHKVFQHKYGTTAQVSLATSLMLTTALNQYYLLSLDEKRNKLYVKIGAKTQEDIEKFVDWNGNEIPTDEVTEGDRFAKYLAYFAATRLYAPGRDFDFTSPIAPITRYIGKLDTYPTTGRKLEEALYAGMGTLIHKDPVDIFRFGASEVAKVAGAESGITKVENAKFDKAVSGIYSSILKDRTDEEGGKSPSFSERLKGITNQGDKIPTGKELNELIPTQTSKIESESVISKEKKVISDSKKQLFKEYNNTYGRTPSFNNFAKFVVDNVDKFPDAGIDSTTKIMSLYSEMIANENRSKGNEDSLIQGSPARVIFDVKIKPLLEIGNMKAAVEELIRLRKINVIKSDSGVNDIAELILSH